MRNKLHPAKAKWTDNYVHLFRDVTENQKACTEFILNEKTNIHFYGYSLVCTKSKLS